MGFSLWKSLFLLKICYDRCMLLIRKVISVILLLSFSFGSIFAFDNEWVLHSLDELPSSHEETIVTLQKTIDLTATPDEGDMISLIAAKESYKAPTDFDKNLAGKIWKVVKSTKITRMSHQVHAFAGIINTELKADTNITSMDNSIIDGAGVGIFEAPEEVKLKWNSYFDKKNVKKGNKKKWNSTISAKTFEFWIPGKHLLFSKPVKIEVEMPNMTDGNEVEIGVLHTGDTTFNTVGLSTSADTLCNSDGSATNTGNITVTQSGKVTFYTCGASSFVMNPTWWITGSNDLRLIIGDCGQFQLYYNSGANIYTGNPPGAGCNNTNDAWIALRIAWVTYGSDWTAWTTNTMTWGVSGNTYTGRTNLTRLVWWLTYTVILDWRYVSPNKFFNIDWSVNIPATNVNNVRFYIANDSTVGGADADDTGYTGSAPSKTVWVFDSVLNQLSAIRYLSWLLWTAEQANGWNTVRTQITNGVDFTNAIQTTAWDLGFWVNWNLGTTPGTYTGALEWRMLPYSTWSIVDLVPWIGTPEWPLMVSYLSQVPVTITNAGTISSSGNHVTVLTLPWTITGPASPFTDNGWSCGAQIGATVTCTKTTTLASLWSDTFRIPVTPTLASSGTTVVFTGTISNSWDLIISNNSAFSTNFVSGSTIVVNPGWVASPQLWLRADNGTNCSTSGCTITTWTNSGLAWVWANGVTASGTVIYSSGSLINGNPTLYFNNASLNTNNTLSITSIFSIFTVSKIWIGWKFPIGSQTGVTNGLEWITTPTFDTFKLWAGATSYSGTNSWNSSFPAITSSTRTSTGVAAWRTNGFQYLTGTLATAITASRIRVGWLPTSSGSLANIWEVIIYNTTLTGTNLNKVESYLATKYGITLSQNTPTNYTLSNSSIWLNGTIMTGYLSNIAWVARDDNSALLQKSSQSVTNTWDIRVTVGSIGTNYSALYWWNNGGATGSLITTDISTGSTRITREWRFEENNTDLGALTISYPMSALPIWFSGTLMMFVDADWVFASGASYITWTLNSTGGIWDFSATISDGEYITFWKNPTGDTAPPVITSISIASGSLLPIGNFSLMMWYVDTGSLISTGSFTGQIFSWNTGSSTWNVTNLAPTYMSITGTTSTTTWQLSINNLPSGKYRFDIAISDNAGNTSTGSYSYYIDGVIWNISSDNYNIWDLLGNVTKFGTGELVITIQTVWAGFTLVTTPITNLISSAPATINYWNGTIGWGYDLWNGFSYSGTITSHSPSVTIATQIQSINTSGEKNTYTYRIKYGALVDSMQNAGNYTSQVSFTLNLTY